tara:strand:- start:1774 stop:2661 length:888 start_codon:yes stop_codon:yes gene_type:complete
MNLIDDKLHVSTITAVSNIDTIINLRLLFDKIEINDYIQYIQYGNDNYKGFSHKLLRKKRKNKGETSFYNCCTIHVKENMDIYVKCPRDPLNPEKRLKSGDKFQKVIGGKKFEFTIPEVIENDRFIVNIDKIINIKIFNNGKIQITGLKWEKQGLDIIKKIINIMKDYEIFEDDKKIMMNDYRIVLINCDFELANHIDRYKLHNEIVKHNYYSSYEPCSYPGVNIKYFINTNNTNGICCCDCMCDGKGIGNGNGDCKRVTIAVFKSGSIIITGGQNVEQIMESYHFITQFISNMN